MAKYLLNVKETYRVDTEQEATYLIEEAKQTKDFTLDKYECTYKERKVKGEVVDSYYKVSLTKVFDNEKEPCNNATVSYSTTTWAANAPEEEEKAEVVFHATV